MKILFVSNYLNYHQSLLMDELEKRGLDFVFLETDLGNSPIKPKTDRRYCTDASSISNENVEPFLNSFDILVYGACGDHRFIRWMPKGKIIFHNSEHYWKKINDPMSLAKRIVRSFELKLRYRGCENLFLLSNSVYLKKEFDSLKIPYRACYRFAYFPPVNINPYVLEIPRENKIIYVGRALKLKRIDHSVLAFERMKQSIPDLKLEIYSEGPFLNRLKKKYSREGISFYPFLPHDKVLEQFAHSKAFVFSSNREEGWGATLNEALSCGCVVFAASQPGSTNRLIHDGRNGFVYRNRQELKEKIDAYLAMDPEEDAAIRKNAFDTIRNLWNERIAAERLVHIFESVTKAEMTGYPDGPLSLQQGIE